MNKKGFFLVGILLIIVISGALLASCASSATATTAPAGGSTAAGEALLQTRCNVCHSVSRVLNAQKTADAWKATVDRMISYGAQLTPQEEQTLVAYLAQNYK